mmetsp:Transcript_6451/g.14072  ORF Transcript_6451/g.14072 Transcript_6451/m.14072 type:complete len:210 (-) Transcript_6451:1448-2077(-)
MVEQGAEEDHLHRGDVARVDDRPQLRPFRRLVRPAVGTASGAVGARDGSRPDPGRRTAEHPSGRKRRRRNSSGRGGRAQRGGGGRRHRRMRHGLGVTPIGLSGDALRGAGANLGECAHLRLGLQLRAPRCPEGGADGQELLLRDGVASAILQELHVFAEGAGSGDGAESVIVVFEQQGARGCGHVVGCGSDSIRRIVAECAQEGLRYLR